MKTRYLKKRVAIVAMCALLLSAAGCSAGSSKAGSASSTADTPAQSSGAAAGSSQTASASGAPGEAASAFQGDPNVNKPGEFPICKETVELEIGLRGDPNVESFEANRLTEWFQEKANIKLKFQLFPSTDKDAKQKCTVMIASGGKLPDVIGVVGFKNDDVALYGEQGVFIPLNEYYENCAYYIPQELKKSAIGDDFYKYITAPDGNRYFVPKLSEQYTNAYPQKMWINTEWLKKVGKEMPKTTDELYGVLKAFKEQDPNGNGQQDEIPLVGSAAGWGQQPHEILMNAFIYNDAKVGGGRWWVENGTLTPVYTQEGWRKGLEYLNKLCTEGLLSPQTFTQDAAQLKKMTDIQDTPITGMFAASSNGNSFSVDNTQRANYDPVAPLTGPDGVGWTGYDARMPEPNFMITRDCKNPQAAFQWADLMWSEESTLRSRLGVPETDWVKMDASTPCAFEEMGVKTTYQAVLKWGQVQSSHWQGLNPMFTPYGMIESEAAPNNPLDQMFKIADAVKLLKDKEPAHEHLVFQLNYTAEELKEVSELKTNVETFVKESMARFITGDMKLDKEWDGYVKELSAMGLERYIEISQAAYDRMNKS